MAQLRNTTISDAGSLNLPAGTTAQRPASPVAGQIRYNTTISDTEYYDGSAWRPISDSNPEATGGTIVDTDIGGVPYRIHLFTNTGNSTFTVSKGGEVEYLIVAGGGGGASRNGGGGGAGGLLTGVTAVIPQNYTIAVGEAGLGGAGGSNNPGNDGGNSSAFGLTAIGGGGGGHWSGNPGRPGGSGGGGHQSSSVTGAGGAGTLGQGNNGGSGSGNTTTGSSGGGGGAGQAGEQAPASRGGNGGHGVVSAINGSMTWYSGGGGGGTNGNQQLPGGQGGLGGGASAPFSNAANIPGNNATSNTGGGGSGGVGSGSGATHLAGGAGGSGIVIVRYRRNASTATTPTRTVAASVPNNYQIINQNLVWYVDAANPVSYPGTGTTLTNIGPSGFNGTLRNSPTFSETNNGYFVLGGTQDIITGTTPPSLQGNPNLTVSGWFRRLSTNPTGRGTWGIGGNVQNQGINSWWNQFNDQLAIDVWSSGTFVASGVDYPLGQWVFMTWQKIAGAMTRANCILWRNLDRYTGTQLTISRAETGTPAINNVGITLGRISPTHSTLTANGWQYGEFFIYDRVLTASEVTHNFNVTRSRYGV